MAHERSTCALSHFYRSWGRYPAGLLSLRQISRGAARILMKHWLFVAVMALAASAVLYYSERHKVPNRVGPEAVLTAAAEAQREVSHPVAEVVRLSDIEEVEIGNSMARR